MGREWGENDEEDYPNQFALQRQAVENALAGRRGQALLREAEAALLAMPDKRLIAHDIVREGQVCFVGAIAAHRLRQQGLSEDAVLRRLEERVGVLRGHFGAQPDDDDQDIKVTAALARVDLGAPQCLAFNMAWENDEGAGWAYLNQGLGNRIDEGAYRWREMLRWVRTYLKPEPAALSCSS